jgi:hypothetical protein
MLQTLNVLFIEPLVLMFLYFPTVIVRGYFESISCDVAFTTEEEAFKRKCFKVESVV